VGLEASIRVFQTYGSSYDSTVKGLTLTGILICAGSTSLACYGVLKELPLGEALPIVLGLILLAFGILFGAYLFAPRGFGLTSEGVLVSRPVRSFIIPYREIVEAKPLDRLTWLGVRLWGSGGLYGFYGLYHLAHIGKAWVYATRRKHLIYLKTRVETYVLSPDPVEKFLQNLLQQLRSGST